MRQPDPGLAQLGDSRYPATIAPLIGLQFIALAWVVLNQFRFHLGLHAGDRSGLVFKGYLGAELFLVLTGFLICHLYASASGGGRLPLSGPSSGTGWCGSIRCTWR